MAIINHEIKNTSSDTPGFLINKFSSGGRIIITTYTDPFSHKISFMLNMNTKDLFEHLLKPTSTFPYVSINDTISTSNYANIVPVVFPNGFVQSITFIASNFNDITSFEIACYGNEANSIIGAKRWFYVHSSSMQYDGSTSYTFKKASATDADPVYSIVPYSYNFIATKFSLSNGCTLLANTVSTDASTRLLQTNTQFDTDADLSTMLEVPASINKYNSTKVPFIQFNLLKS